MTQIRTRSPEETADAGRVFASTLRPGDVVALTGELGSGKTRFVAGVCAGLGVRAPVTSPSFTLINEYPAPFGLVVHVDLYRISGDRELAELGIEEYFTEKCITLIEWAERAERLLPQDSRRVSFAHAGAETVRLLTYATGEEARR